MGVFFRDAERILNRALRNRFWTCLFMSIFSDKKRLIFFDCLLFSELSAERLSIRVEIMLTNDKNNLLTF
jgi:hypothetical protein